MAKKIVLETSRVSLVSLICLEIAQKAILAMFRATNLFETEMCPNLAPLFLQPLGVNTHNIVSSSVNPDALACRLTLKMVIFTLF